jgi:steroid delta-isomerase-like uncharacterized protein
MSEAIETNTVRRLFEEAFNTGKMDLADDVVASDYTDHSTLPAPAPGLEGFKQRISNLRRAFPDATMIVDDIFGHADRVVFRWTFRGTDTGGFMGRPPTNNRVTVTGINIERIEDGKIVEHWSAPDNLGMLQQLGIVPSLGRPSS